MPTARVVAPAGRLDRERFEKGLSLLQKNNFQITLGEHLFSSEGYFSSGDPRRLDDLQKAFNSEEDIIWMARGGYGTGRILDQLSWSKFESEPKWIIGFSDITLLLLSLVKRGFHCIHGPMVQSIGQLNGKSISCIDDILEGKYLVSWKAQRHSGNEVRARVCGGNLSLVVNAIGTGSEPEWENYILFLEEVNEPFHKIDRMLNQLQRAGILERVRGLVMGEFPKLTDVDPVDLLLEKIPNDLPFSSGFPAGHGDQNIPIPFGIEVIFHPGSNSLLKGIQ